MPPRCLKHGIDMMQVEAYPFASHYCPLCALERNCTSCAALRARVAVLEKVAEAARDSIHDCSCKNGVTYEYVDGMPVAEIPCPFCWALRAALDALGKEKP
jgi:hypothetical protein